MIRRALAAAGLILSLATVARAETIERTLTAPWYFGREPIAYVWLEDAGSLISIVCREDRVELSIRTTDRAFKVFRHQHLAAGVSPYAAISISSDASPPPVAGHIAFLEDDGEEEAIFIFTTPEEEKFGYAPHQTLPDGFLTVRRLYMNGILDVIAGARRQIRVSMSNAVGDRVEMTITARQSTPAVDAFRQTCKL